MKITFYKTASETNRLTKALTLPVEFNGTLKDETDLLNPEITFEADVNLTGYNFAYIEEFGRYYFINGFTSVRNNLWRVSLHVDVLMTYRDGILQNDVIIDKQQGTNFSSEFYNDGSFAHREDVFIETHEYPYGFNDDGEFILLTAGAISGGNA